MDISTAYLNGELDEELYMLPPSHQQLNKFSEMTCLSGSGWKWLEFSGVSEISDYPVV